MPTGLVVKNGSNARAATSSDIPEPVSVMAKNTCSPGVVCVIARVVGIQAHDAGLERDSPGSDDGVARVDHQVHDHLLQAADVDLHLVRRLRQRQPDLEVLADEAADHRRHPFDDLVDADDGRVNDLLARERQQLLRQRGAAPRRLGGALQELDRRRTARLRPPGEIDESQHGCQQVVEVVGDAAGQPADALQLLQLPELLLQARLDLFGLLSRGDVGGAQRGGDDLTALDERPRPHRPPFARTVRSRRAQDLVFVELARREHLLDRRDDARPRLGRDVVEGARSDHVFGLKRRLRAVDEADRPGPIDGHDDVGRRQEDGPQLRLRVTDLELVAAPLVEVAHERHEQPVGETLGGHLGLHLAAVLAEEGPLLLHDLAGSDDGQRFDQPRVLAQGQDIGDRFAHELSRLVAEQAVTARVHLDETTLVCRDEDSVRRPLDQHPKRLIGQTAGMARLIERHDAPPCGHRGMGRRAHNQVRGRFLLR